MANKKIWKGILAIMLVCGLTVVGCNNGSTNQTNDGSDVSLINLVGVWEGSYYARQGETGMTLDVYKENDTYKALFSFYNLPDRTNSEAGKYTMNVSYASGEYLLEFDEWLSKPPTYISLDFKGTISGDVFSGDCYNNTSIGAGGSFSASRK